MRLVSSSSISSISSSIRSIRSYRRGATSARPARPWLCRSAGLVYKWPSGPLVVYSTGLVLSLAFSPAPARPRLPQRHISAILPLHTACSLGNLPGQTRILSLPFSFFPLCEAALARFPIPSFCHRDSILRSQPLCARRTNEPPDSQQTPTSRRPARKPHFRPRCPDGCEIARLCLYRIRKEASPITSPSSPSPRWTPPSRRRRPAR